MTIKGKSRYRRLAVGWPLCAGAMGMLLVISSPTFSEPQVAEDRVYYEFEAHNRAEIWQQISRHSPRGNVVIAGNHAVNVAVTEWRLSSRYRYQVGIRRCQLVDVKPVLQITIRMPHWKNKWQAKEKLVADWDRYVRMVSQHEEVHRQYALAMAKELHDRAQSLSEFKTCEEAVADFQRLQEDVITTYQAKNKAFDAQDFVYQKNLRWF